MPVSFFFDGAPRSLGVLDLSEADPNGDAAALDAFLATSDGIRLVTAYTGIRDQKVRWAIVALVEQITTDAEK